MKARPIEQFQPTLPWWRVPTAWMVFGGPALVVVASFATFGLALHGRDRPLLEAGSAEQGATTDAMQARNHAASPARR
ncbi:hypothetical protein LRH25_12425 [Ideonella azotifigens]|uniref:Nitrogen fixation protein FixH n=1 Tax=Ideonella azotifigens TaxID=513160 RepID=A0ABP3V255_9BURK|nr:hypothetical protein [Ideonella azotifigens]MCD2341149.1 hypothetical protein [Ideonella azotifigens]